MFDISSSGRAHGVLSGKLQSSFVHWLVILAETWVLCLVLNSSWHGACPPGRVGFKQGKNLGYTKLLEFGTYLLSCAAVSFWWESILAYALIILLIVSCPVSVEDWNALFLKDSGIGSFLRLQREKLVTSSGREGRCFYCCFLCVTAGECFCADHWVRR